MPNKVFLGGTWNESKWRDEIEKLLEIEYFNPIVSNWNEEAQKKEEQAKKECDWFLFVITPKMTGAFSIAEVVDYSNKKPDNTILCVLDEDEGKKWSESQKKSLDQVEKMVEENGGKVLDSIKEVADYLNKYAEIEEV